MLDNLIEKANTVRRRLDSWNAVNDMPGGDRQLQDAANALVEETIDTPYVPPIPVPISSPISRDYETQRGLRSAVWLAHPTTISNSIATVGTLVGGGNADGGEDFPINSIMVDNFSMAWVHFPEVGVFVPPFNIGRVFRFDGSRHKRVLYEQPTGLANSVTAGTSQITQLTRVVYHEQLLPETAGFVLPTTNQ